MPSFEPFAALRYAEEIDLNEVTAPPYDVIGPAARRELAARTAYNIVHVDLPDEAEGPGRYAAAARRLAAWAEEGVLVTDNEPGFYVYAMGYRDGSGRPRQTVGVIGALGLVPPGDGVLPHERTTPKAKSDRLKLLRATGANLSPIWGLSLAEGLGALCEPSGPPVGRATDADGVHHRLWRVTAPAMVEALRERVASAPVVIADGHHRWETSLAYRDEVGAAGNAGPADATLALVVELSADQLDVRPIHRLLTGLDGVDVLDSLAPWFDALETHPADASLPARMDDAGALALVVPGGVARLLRPRAAAFPDDTPDLDSSRLDMARAALPAHEVAFEAELAEVLAAVEGGGAGVLLRPATVAQIAATAGDGERMPPKTTYFLPKPRTCFVLRELA
ncbi:DUF1015 domain-containing protein [soil metagenome]